MFEGQKVTFTTVGYANSLPDTGHSRAHTIDPKLTPKKISMKAHVSAETDLAKILEAAAMRPTKVISCYLDMIAIDLATFASQRASQSSFDVTGGNWEPLFSSTSGNTCYSAKLFHALDTTPHTVPAGTGR